MSNSRVYKVPDDLHENVEKAYMEFCSKNPILTMGADERRRLLRSLTDDSTIAGVIACANPPPPWASDLGFDPDDENILQCLRPYKSAREFLRLVRGWPRSEREREVFARRAKYSTFVTQYVQQGLGRLGTHNSKFSEGTHGWDPSTAKTLTRKAFL